MRVGLPLALLRTERCCMFVRKQVYISLFVLGLIELAVVVIQAAK
jgi:hypothetical protein